MRTLSLCACAAAATACASSAATQELVDARRAYAVAEVSQAPQLEPDKLLTARQALERAEAAHRDDPGSKSEAHLAYLAERKAQVAVVEAEIAAIKRGESKADENYTEQLEHSASGNQAELNSARHDLATEQAAHTAADARTVETQKSLERARAASPSP